MNQIKKYRKKKKLTLDELASLVGISSGYLCHLELGTRQNPSYKIMLGISKALGEEMSTIFP